MVVQRTPRAQGMQRAHRTRGARVAWCAQRTQRVHNVCSARSACRARNAMRCARRVMRKASAARGDGSVSKKFEFG